MTTFLRAALAASVGVVVSSMLAGWSSAATVQADAKILSGWQAPSALTGVVLGQPASNPAVISDTVRAAGVFSLSGPGVGASNDSALYVGSGGGAGNVQLVARDADPAPGLGGIPFSNFQNVALNGDTYVHFNADLASGDVSNNYAAFAGTPGAIQVVVREGDQAPHLAPGLTQREFHNAGVNAAGQSAYLAFLQGAGVSIGVNDSVIYSGPIGSPALIHRGGDPAPGFGAGVNLRQLGVPQLHDSGRVAFFGRLNGSGITTADDDALWAATTGAPATLSLLRRAGSAAPGTSAGVNFSTFGQPLLGGSTGGVVAFQGVLTGAGVNINNNNGIWSGLASAPLKVIRAGDQVPLMAAGTTFTDLGPGSSFAGPSDTGRMALQVTFAGPGIIQGSNDRAIYIGDGTFLKSVARLGDPVPGGGPGQLFTFFNDWVINEDDVCAFVGSWGFNANQSGIFAAAGAGQLVPILRPGDTVDLGGGDLRTLASFNFGETTIADRVYLNDDGLLTLKAFFTNGTSGVIMVPIPEPAGAALLGGALFIPFLRRRRQLHRAT